MDKVGIGRNGHHRQVGIPEGVPDLMGLFGGEGLFHCVKILEGHIQLHAVEVGGLDPADDLLHVIGVVTCKNTNADHLKTSSLFLIPGPLPGQSVDSSSSLRATVRFSAMER